MSRKNGPDNKTSVPEGILALLMLALALAIFFQSVVAVELKETFLVDLPPGPDAPEYFAGGHSIFLNGVFRIHLCGEELPPRYPFGYSSLIAAALFLGCEPIEAPFRVNHMAGMALILGLFVAGWTHGRRLAAGLSVLLLTTLPAFIVLARSPMSELTSALVIFLGFFSLYRYASGSSLLWGLIGTALLGLSVLFKLVNILLLPASLVATWLSGREFQRKLRESVLLTVAMSIGVFPLLVYQQAAFGNPLETGYGFWIPFSSPSQVFSISYLPTWLSYLADEILPPQTRDTVASIFGGRNYFGPAFLLLAVGALFAHWKERNFRILALPGLGYAFALFFYFYNDFRLLFPVMVLSLPWISQAWLSWIRTSGWRVRLFLYVPLLLAQLSIFPGRNLDPDFHRYVTPERLKVRPPVAYPIVQEFLQIRDAEDALILTDLNPAYVHALTGGQHTVTFLVDENDYRFSPGRFACTEHERCAQLELTVSGEGSAYILATTTKTEVLEKLCPPVLETHAWKILQRGPTNAWIAQLTVRAETGSP